MTPSSNALAVFNFKLFPFEVRDLFRFKEVLKVQVESISETLVLALASSNNVHSVIITERRGKLSSSWSEAV